MLQSLGRALQQPQPLAASQRQSATHRKLVIASCERADASFAAPARRALLVSLAAAAGSLLLQSPAAALNLRSQQSQVRHQFHMNAARKESCWFLASMPGVPPLR